MTRFYFATVLFLSLFAGYANADHVTLTSGCESINVPRVLLQDAVDAGLYEWLASRCQEMHTS